jgi:hypothetical protein
MAKLTEQQLEFENQYILLNYNLIRTKLFLTTGLELNNTSIYFNTNSDFEHFGLLNLTCAFFNPVDNSIHINIEDEFISNSVDKTEKNAKLLFLLFHEISHKIYMHDSRCNNRDKTLWNMAADYEIHNMYATFSQIANGDATMLEILKNYMTIIDGFLLTKDTRFMYSPEYQDKIAEEIYELLLKDSKSQSKTINIPLQNFLDYGSNGNGDSKEDKNQNSNSDKENGKSNSSGLDVEIEEVTTTLPNGKTIKHVNIKFPENNELPDDLKKSEDEIKQEKQNIELNKTLNQSVIEQIAKEKGDMSVKCKQFLKKMFHVKVDWEKILRNSLHTILEKSDYFAWNKTRTSTFLLPHMSYLPAIIEDETKFGTLIISQDESGSMTNEQIEKITSIILEAKEHYNKIILLKHDTKITNVIEFEQDDFNDNILTEIKTRYSFGGTSHKDVFDYIKKYKEEHKDETISCYIGISDLESDIMKCEKTIPSDVPVIWLTSANSAEYYQNKICGLIIPVEI